VLLTYGKFPSGNFMKTHSSYRAFTLVELLVVIAIVALLSAILFPVFLRAKAAAHKTATLSNMSQIGKAVVLYLTDFDDRFPRTMDTSSGSTETIGWWAIHNYQASLVPYIAMGRGGVNQDGQINNRQKIWYDPLDPDKTVPFMWGSYTANGHLTGVERNLSDVADPSSTAYSTLREKSWDRVVGVSLPNGMPSEDDPFWSSEYFDMCLDPWADTTDATYPYHWSKGLATPPCSLFPGHPFCADWDLQIDGRSPLLGPKNKPRYGAGQIYSFVDGHARFLAFEQTFPDIDDNMWDIK
jgi:prepilin-type N-terminal cleavage/methylation domain-containing protein